MAYRTLFEGRRLAIATKHRKESVIAPMCEQELGVKCFVPENIDTDQFGMFSSEVERVLSPIESARQKCELAMEMTGADLAIASEGSFGSHPSFFFTAADDEIVLLYDKKNNLEIIGRKLSTETNFGGSEVKSLAEALSMAKHYQFTNHALIVRSEENSIKPIHKGLQTTIDFEAAVEATLAAFGKAWIETDMRAMFNPTRMAVIEQATHNLIEKLKSTCPACDTPGFDIVEVLSGLPCGVCNLPTKSTLAHIYQCQKCHHKNRKEFPKDKKTESPQYCDFCNP